MIQTLTVTAYGSCTNCKGKIKRGRGDLESVDRWWHEQGGKETCPQAPVATPFEGSVTEVSITCPRCAMTSFHPEDVKQGYCGNCHEFTGADNPGSVVYPALWRERFDTDSREMVWQARCTVCSTVVATKPRPSDDPSRPEERYVHIHSPSGVRADGH